MTNIVAAPSQLLIAVAPCANTRGLRIKTATTVQLLLDSHAGPQIPVSIYLTLGCNLSFGCRKRTNASYQKVTYSLPTIFRNAIGVVYSSQIISCGKDLHDSEVNDAN